MALENELELAHAQIESILKNKKPLLYTNAKGKTRPAQLFMISKEEMNAVRDQELRLKDAYHEVGKKPPRGRPLFQICNIIHPQPIAQYKLSEQVKHKVIRDQEKIHQRLKLNFQKQIDLLEDEEKRIKQSMMSEEYKKMYLYDIEKQKRHYVDQFEYIQKYKDQLEFVETNYAYNQKHDKYRVMITFDFHLSANVTKAQKEKNHTAYLRDTVPNLMIFIAQKIRRDDKMQRYINDPKTVHAFFDIYYQVKDAQQKFDL